jgi:hypothetical protein
MTRLASLPTLLLFGLVCTLAGCKPDAAKQGDGTSAVSKQAADAPPTAEKQTTVIHDPSQPRGANLRRGVGNMLPSVQRGFAELDLQNIAKLYCIEALAGNSPKKIESLGGLEPRVIQAVKSGEYVILWGAGANTPGTAVIAYEKDVPTKGGMVANFTGTVTRMTPQEFQAAPKAAKP